MNSDKQTQPAPDSSGVPSDMRHTPTPWKIVRRHPDPHTNANCIEILPEVGGVFGKHSSIEIACMHCAEDGGVQAANARLIVEAVNSYAANQAKIAKLEGALAEIEHQTYCAWTQRRAKDALSDSTPSKVTDPRVAKLEADKAELEGVVQNLKALLMDARNVMQLSANVQDAHRESLTVPRLDMAVGLKRVIRDIDAALSKHQS